ncbi:hypothetical protein P171DRAFT_487933 [Karstenula rhodostoma CBS 690.94]|uniref:BTB domain-containing protein n=1 Tax=Karstenula rhodostoma CBS 690.94 TaxID=1392251 RepID=A0A9P4U9V5_9PLEO|nr:hypothetical protein P171DRAFT_487933 [Karstenula rhodostoma CBS 690.94]
MADNKNATDPTPKKAPEVLEKDKPKLNPLGFYSSGVVNVKVGPKNNEKTFQMHKALAIHHSGFFRGAFSSDNFQEGATGEVTLRDVTHDTFAMFLVWLYKGALRPAKRWPEVYHDGDEIQHDLLRDLCIFADRYIVQALHTHIVALAVEYYAIDEECVGYGHVKRAFENLPETDPYLKLLVDTHCLYWEPDRDDEEELVAFADLPVTFLHRVMAKYADLASRKISRMGLEKSDYIPASGSGSGCDKDPPRKRQKTSN